jgi:serine/threonine protein kinase
VSKGYMRRIRLDYRRELVALATLSKVRHISYVDFRAAGAQINVLL